MNTITFADGVTISQNHDGGMIQVVDPTRAHAGEPRRDLFSRPTLEQLFVLAWIPVTERMPTEEDGDELGDVEWSDGAQSYHCSFDKPFNATHWRRIVLP